VCTEHTGQKLMHALSVGMKFEKVPSTHAEHKCKELMHALSINIRTEVYAEHTHQKLNDA
jgi:hypothetical protein